MQFHSLININSSKRLKSSANKPVMCSFALNYKLGDWYEGESFSRLERQTHICTGHHSKHKNKISWWKCPVALMWSKPN